MKTIDFPSDCDGSFELKAARHANGCVNVGSFLHFKFSKAGFLDYDQDDAFKSHLPRGHFKKGKEKFSDIAIKKSSDVTFTYLVDGELVPRRYVLTIDDTGQCKEDSSTPGHSPLSTESLFKLACIVIVGLTAVLLYSKRSETGPNE